MAAKKWSGFDDGDIELDFAGKTFKVHRLIIAGASPVWKAMLTGGAFTESTANTIEFDGDDPEVARCCIALIYLMFSGDDGEDDGEDDGADGNGLFGSTSKEARRAVMDGASGGLEDFVDKYDLCGVKRFLEHEADATKEKQRLEGEVKSEKHHVQDLEHQVQRLKYEARRKATRPGELVNIFEYRPPIGTRVQENLYKWNETRRLRNNRPIKQGKVIRNDEDCGTKIGVLWDNGWEQHQLYCGTRGGWALKYI